MLPFKVSVAQNKGKVMILSMGEATFASEWVRGKTAQEPPSLVYIPHRMQVGSHCSGRFWVFDILVTEAGKAQYQCRWKDLEGVTGGWQSSPSAAYTKTNLKLEAMGKGNPKFNRKENGALLVGVKYPAMQQVIRDHFRLGEQVEKNEGVKVFAEDEFAYVTSEDIFELDCIGALADDSSWWELS
ncbi:hypothetical protein BASA81_006458 [Batrachochytrium salamandrivorans]|nr:hypothetical protein BASA81_006458 [Batrachochytrium salamandrivorans]